MVISAPDNSLEIIAAIREELDEHRGNAVRLWEDCGLVEEVGVRYTLAQFVEQRLNEPPEPPQAFAMPGSFGPEQQEEFFTEIVRFFDLADGMVASLARPSLVNRAAQLALATVFVTRIVTSTNIIVAFYTDVVRGGRVVTRPLQEAMEQSFQEIFLAFKDFLDEAEEQLPPQAA